MHQSNKSSPEVARLIELGANPFERAVLALFHSVGALASEIAAFRVSDISWTAEGSAGNIVVGSIRNLPLHEAALRVLRRYVRQIKPHQHWLFEKAEGVPYRPEEILRLLNRFAEREKIRKIEATGGPVAARFRIRRTDPKTLDQIEPVPFNSAEQFARLRAIYDNCFQHPSEEITQREEEIERIALEKIHSAVAKKAGQ